MSYHALMQKISSEKLHLNPSLQDVMARVREVGLHKVAAHMHNVPAFEVKTAVQLLGTRLYLQRHRQSKIASGLRALSALESSGDLPFDTAASTARMLGAAKIASMFRLSPGGIKNLVPEAGQAAQQASHVMPKTLGPSVAESAQHSGLFGNIKPNADDLDLSQTIAKLRNEEMSMGLRPSAPLPPAGGAPPVPATAAPKPSQFREPEAGLQQLTQDVNQDMARAHEGVANNPNLKPVPAEDEMMWRNIYDSTKLREAEAASRGQAMPGLHPSAQGTGPTMLAGKPPPAAPLGATVPGRRPPQPPAGPGATVKLPQG